MTGLDADVVLGGGIFSSGDEDFVGTDRPRIGEVARRARVRVLEAPPVLGAALLGLDAIGARPAAMRRARAALAETASARARDASDRPDTPDA